MTVQQLRIAWPRATGLNIAIAHLEHVVMQFGAFYVEKGL